MSPEVKEKEIIKNLQIDFTFIDKVLTHMVGLTKEELRKLLEQYDQVPSQHAEYFIKDSSRSMLNVQENEDIVNTSMLEQRNHELTEKEPERPTFIHGNGDAASRPDASRAS